MAVGALGMPEAVYKIECAGVHLSGASLELPVHPQRGLCLQGG